MTKGDATKQRIQKKAELLFETKGFIEVTMSDVCEITGLSRGGLYRHYGSTAEIFMDIMEANEISNNTDILDLIQKEVPAVDLANKLLNRMINEMIMINASLLRALNEFCRTYPNEGEELYTSYLNNEQKVWEAIIQYGIETEEFRYIDVERTARVIVLACYGQRVVHDIHEEEEDKLKQLKQGILDLLVDTI